MASRSRWLWLPAVGCLAVAVIAVGGRGRPSAAAPGCLSHRPPAGAGAASSITVGRVLFVVPVGARPGDALQHGTAADGRRFSKFGLWVFGDERVSVEAVGAVDIVGWAQGGATARVTHRVSFSRVPARPCAQQTWQVYPGGLIYRRPQCAVLRVRAHGQISDVRFGLGTDCRSSTTPGTP